MNPVNSYRGYIVCVKDLKTATVSNSQSKQYSLKNAHIHGVHTVVDWLGVCGNLTKLVSLRVPQ